MTMAPIKTKGGGTPKALRKSSTKRVRGRSESKVVAEFNRWMKANAKEVGAWARANTKRLTGKEIL